MLLGGPHSLLYPGQVEDGEGVRLLGGPHSLLYPGHVVEYVGVDPGYLGLAAPNSPAEKTGKSTS